MPVKLNEEMRRLLIKENVAVVGTVNARGVPNLALKGVVRVDLEGYVYFFDLFRGKTHANLKRNPSVAVSVFNIHEFKGYQFKGRAEVIESGPLFDELAARWVAKKRTLITQRIADNVRRGFSHGRSEVHFPHPRYLVRMEVGKIHNLVPPALLGRGRVK
jgi:hypothetical protein